MKRIIYMYIIDYCRHISGIIIARTSMAPQLIFMKEAVAFRTW